MPTLPVDLAQLKADKLYRRRRNLDSATGIHACIDGQQYLSFCSNDYLGLANHPDVIQAMKKGAERWGVGSGASHLVTGHTSAHHALEQELAEFTGRERALLFSSGYMANMGVISALCGRGDTIFQDRLNHASLLDGGLLSQARMQRYAHNDAKALASKLEKNTRSTTQLIITDGVFSMDGDIAPMPELSQLAQQHDAWLMMDDAHGLGVLGEQGRGTLNHLGLSQNDCPILMGTLGKAFGSFGAFITGSEELIEFLINKARSYIYTTAIPAAVAEATRTSLKLVQQDQWRRDQLSSLISQFRTGAEQLGLALMPSATPIQPLLIGDSGKALAISQALLDKGLLVSAIRPPTVPTGTARLRITLSAAHSPADVEQLLGALESIT